MIELWYTILAFSLIIYVVLDGRNFGVGALHFLAARTAAERRQIVSAIGPLWSWHEVWLLAVGGILFAAFPGFLATSFAGYYLALFLVLWALIGRGIALEVGGHIDNSLWQQFWDVAFAACSVLLAILFGAAFGNVVRGVPLNADGEFHMALFTNFRTTGNVGLLDWYTVSLGVLSLVMLAAHGATYLVHKTDGSLRHRSKSLARPLWLASSIGFIAISIASLIVRPELFANMGRHMLAWPFIVVAVAGVAALFIGLRGQREGLAYAGSCMVIAGILSAGAASLFPVLLHSTLDPAHSMTVYDAASAPRSLTVAAIWWPFALVLSVAYFLFILKQYRGKVKATEDGGY